MAVILKQLFPLYPEDDALSQCQILHVDLHPERREVSVQLQAGQYLPMRKTGRMEKQLARLYGLRQVALDVCYAPDLLEQMDFSDLSRLFIRHNSMAGASLAGAVWQLDGKILRAQLRANGLEHLAPSIPAVEQYLRAHFGREVQIEIQANHALEGEALFAATEQLRRTAVEQMPQPEAAASAPKAAKKAAPETAGPILFGKPFHGKPVPMDELELNMNKVIVEGEVTAINHKELKKRNAWIISFDMTDYRSSIRIHAFLDTPKARPILEGVQGPNAKKKKPGMWLRVFGQLSLSNYDNEMILKPYSIAEADRPVRVDRAKEKRVELHLHTNMSSMDALTDTTLAVRQAAAPQEGVEEIYGLMCGFADAHQYLRAFRWSDAPGEFTYAERHSVLLEQICSLLEDLCSGCGLLLEPDLITFLAESILNSSVKQYPYARIRAAIQKLLA